MAFRRKAKMILVCPNSIDKGQFDLKYFPVNYCAFFIFLSILQVTLLHYVTCGIVVPNLFLQADENLLKIKLYGSSNGDLNGNVSEGNLYPPEIEAELEPCLLKPDKTKCYRIGFFPEDAPQGYPRGSLPFVHQVCPQKLIFNKLVT